MAVSTTLEIVQSYVGLLIMQYLNKSLASGFINTIVSPAVIPQVSVQTISFSPAPTTGTFVLSYNAVNSASIAWNDTAATIQSDLQAISGLGSVTVAGSIAAGLTVTFTGVAAPALSLIVASSSLLATATPVIVTVTEIDLTIPLAIQNAYNFVRGTSIAQGIQLDVIGDYVGVSRMGLAFSGVAIVLDDTEFATLIQMGIIKNQSGSSLGTIQNYLYEFFTNAILLYDNANMTMTYVIGEGIGSSDLVQLFVTEGLLPAPMAVQIEVFYVPTTNLFSFRTYELPNTTGSPFNDYASYQTDWPWLSYQNVVVQ